jgi:hypothetical protein
VSFYTYPKFIFTWPLILLGLILWPVAEYSDTEILAWVWMVTLIVIMITVGFDLNRNVAIFCVVFIAAFWFLILWLNAKEIHLFTRIYRYFAELDPSYSKNLGLIVSIILGILYLIMWLVTRLNCHWRVTHNEFEHYQFGRQDDSLARGAKRIRVSYPDIFELLLCLAGELIIYDSTGRRELRRIQHVPFLPYVKKKINRLMESTAITAAELEDEADGAADIDVEDDSDRSL